MKKRLTPKKKKKFGLKIRTSSADAPSLRASEGSTEEFIDDSGAAVGRSGLADSVGDVAFDDLQQIERLGSGVQGDVYRVRDKRSNREFAMKERKLVQVEDEETRRSIVRELKTLKRFFTSYSSDLTSHYIYLLAHLIHLHSKLYPATPLGAPSHTPPSCRHKYVVSLYDAFYENATMFLLLELMDGGTLRHLLVRKGALPEPVLGKLVCHVLEGLVYIHTELKIVHRDIKPENLLLNSLGEVKLADFGVSGHLVSTMGMAQTFLGATAYMSPERIKGEPHSANSDCWSLALVLLECAAGEFPFEGAAAGAEAPNYWAMWQKICNEPPPVLDPRFGFSDEFNDFIAQCLVKDPNKRASSTDLLEHEWIKGWKKDKFKLAKWLSKSRAANGK